MLAYGTLKVPVIAHRPLLSYFGMFIEMEISDEQANIHQASFHDSIRSINI